MATTSVSDLGDAELVQRLADAKEELFKMRFQLATGQFDNTARVKQVKKEIARVLTELRVREIAEAEAAAGGEA